MEQTLDFNYILDLMSHNYGLAGIFSNPGFGKTTLMMQIIDEINKRKDGTAIVMSNESLSKQRWIEQMQRLNLSTERIIIDERIDKLNQAISSLREKTNENFELKITDIKDEGDSYNFSPKGKRKEHHYFLRPQF